MQLTSTPCIPEVDGMSKLPTMTSDELRAIRAEMGDTQAEAAARYGVVTSTYKRWEQDVRVIPGPAVVLGRLLLDLHRATLKPKKD